MTCDDTTVRLHEHRMGQAEHRIERLEGDLVEARQAINEQLTALTEQVVGVRVDVQKALNEGLQAIVSGVAGDAREALITAKSAHARMDEFVAELRSLKSMQNQLAMKVAAILAGLAAAGGGLWQVLSRIFGVR